MVPAGPAFATLKDTADDTLPVCTMPDDAAGHAAPRYPRSMARQGIEGIVMLRIQVGPDGGTGRIVRVWTSSGHEALDSAAVEAARQWVFRPGCRDGVATRRWVQVPVRFRIQ